MAQTTSVVQKHDVQTGLLQRFKVESTPVILRLLSGDKLEGIVKRYDMFTIDFRTSDGKIHLFYKHGIAGFSTMKALDTCKVSA